MASAPHRRKRWQTISRLAQTAHRQVGPISSLKRINSPWRRTTSAMSGTGKRGRSTPKLQTGEASCVQATANLQPSPIAQGTGMFRQKQAAFRAMRPGFIILNQSQKISPFREAIRRKRPGKLTHGVLFHHDNARPHTAKHTMETLSKLGWEVCYILPIVPFLIPVSFIFSHTLKLLYGEDSRRIWRWKSLPKIERLCRRIVYRDIVILDGSLGFDTSVESWNQSPKCRSQHPWPLGLFGDLQFHFPNLPSISTKMPRGKLGKTNFGMRQQFISGKNKL
ncbi:hypothetical protein LAZ67_6002491 [Cordylochernes scorpioides]|uniref:Transposase n=1 Tax=Cordylochernes scorpioides TaxID=51811 RepID=A0ABY6KJU3_9ARAC|nr:hypothetical protein LAZ67_6002491 [Cordylochernes scorpioides]